MRFIRIVYDQYGIKNYILCPKRDKKIEVKDCDKCYFRIRISKTHLHCLYPE